LFRDGVSHGENYEKLHHCVYCMMQSFRHLFFFWMVALLPKASPPNEFINYHLIILKHKYHDIKLYTFHDFFLHFILSSVSNLWCLSICIIDRFFLVWHEITPFFQQRVTWKINMIKNDSNSDTLHLLLSIWFVWCLCIQSRCTS
jgi:hypothetical protein